MTRSFLWLAAVATLVSARAAHAQAWPDAKGTGDVTFVFQEIDHVGRMDNEGVRRSVGKAINFSIDVEVDYALTDRWSLSTTMPFVFSKYTDKEDAPYGLPFQEIDNCRCWNNSFADFGIATQYTVVNVNNSFVLTPFFSAGVPSHAYAYAGEAVVGRRLKEVRLGAAAGQRLGPYVSLQARYGYTITEHVEQVPDVPNNRSNGSAILHVAFPGGFSTRGIAFWQRTHGGLRFPCEVTDPPTVPDPEDPPFPPCPNEGPIDDARMTEFHRMLRDNYLHLGWGLSYALGSWALSGEYLWTARGSNSHDIRVLSITAGRSFEVRHR